MPGRVKLVALELVPNGEKYRVKYNAAFSEVEKDQPDGSVVFAFPDGVVKVRRKDLNSLWHRGCGHSKRNHKLYGYTDAVPVTVQRL